MLDLARWADGSYRIPAEPVEPADDEDESSRDEGPKP